MPDVRFNLTIPADAQLVPAIRQIAERLAQTAGYPATESLRIASSVGQAVESVLARRADAADGNRTGLDIRFEREGGHLDVWVRYHADPCDRPGVDAALSGEALRQGMDSVEFGREGDIAFCRLRRALPPREG